MTRGSAVRRALGAAVTVFVVACADKAVAPAIPLSPRFTIRVMTTARRTADASKLLVVAVYFSRPRPSDRRLDDSVRFLGGTLVDNAGSEQPVNMKVDLTECLSDAGRYGSRDACSMYIGVFLEPASFDTTADDFFGPALDYNIVGPYDAAPGHPPTVPSIDMSKSRFTVNAWEPDESLQLGGRQSPELLTGPISGFGGTGTGQATLFALTQSTFIGGGTGGTPFYGSVLAVLQNGTWRRVNGVGANTNNNIVFAFVEAAAFAANDVYLASNDPVGLYHYDGAAISPVPGFRGQLRSVAVSPASVSGRNVIASDFSGNGVSVGNGTTFTKYSIAGLTQIDNVCINGPTEAFASSRTNGSSVFRFNGTTWTSVQTASTSGKSDLQCLGSGQAYVTAGGTLNRWNGTGWTALAGPPGTNGRILSFAVVSANEMYAAGDSGSTNRAFYRFDGTSWREVGRLTFTNGGGGVRIWADPRGGVAYVSSIFSGATTRIDMVTPSSVTALTYNPQLRDVALPTPTSAFVVGGSFFLSRWNGVRWTVDAPPTGTLTTPTLNGVWASDANNAWAVGQQSTIVRWDGTRWNLLSDSRRPIVSPTDNYNAVWGTGGTAWIVGDASIIRCATTTTCATSAQPGAALYGVWGSSSSDIFAVGTAGRIFHFDGTNWTPMNSATSAKLTRVSGSGPKDVYAAGDTAVVHFDGTSWKLVTSDLTIDKPFPGYQSPLNFFQTALWGVNPNEVYYGLWNGQILRGGGPYWGASLASVNGAVTFAISGIPNGCALAITDGLSRPGGGAARLLRGVGTGGCLSAAMSAPTSWP